MKKEAPEASWPSAQARHCVKNGWLGVMVDASFEERTEVERLLFSLAEHLGENPNLRLMDFGA